MRMYVGCVYVSRLHKGWCTGRNEDVLRVACLPYVLSVAYLPAPGRKAPGMRSVLMQLRKCCNHAFLLDGVEEEHAIQVCSHLRPLVAAQG